MAVHEGASPGECPHVGDKSSQGRILALMWFRGYRAEQLRISHAHLESPFPES